MRSSKSKAGRNDACACGSGKKHKRCCGPKHEAHASSSRLVIAVVLAALLGVIVAGVNSFRDDSSAAVPGKVWSPEHGHYH